MPEEFASADPAGEQFVDSGIFDCGESPAGDINHPEMLWHGGIPCLS
ncbi:hypothetical protein [Mesorhizobium sp. 131-2-1]|nr:hypothetical protein [Mesorhizobium sp. 131-2-1]